jgi:hypothetical protein
VLGWTFDPATLAAHSLFPLSESLPRFRPARNAKNGWHRRNESASSIRLAEKRGFQISDGSYSAKNRILPVIFRGKILRCGITLGGKFSKGIDFKRVKNNLQSF